MYSARRRSLGEDVYRTVVHIARDCAVDSDWEDPEFVGLVGKRKRARSER